MKQSPKADRCSTRYDPINSISYDHISLSTKGDNRNCVIYCSDCIWNSTKLLALVLHLSYLWAPFNENTWVCRFVQWTCARFSVDAKYLMRFHLRDFFKPNSFFHGKNTTAILPDECTTRFALGENTWKEFFSVLYEIYPPPPPNSLFHAKNITLEEDPQNRPSLFGVVNTANQIAWKSLNPHWL